MAISIYTILAKDIEAAFKDHLPPKAVHQLCTIVEQNIAMEQLVNELKSTIVTMITLLEQQERRMDMQQAQIIHTNKDQPSLHKILEDAEKKHNTNTDLIDMGQAGED